MAVISIPRPSKKSYNPGRAANGLLLYQVKHLQHAECRLPLRYRSKIYTHAILTEREAASYIREVTEAIHQAHADASAGRAKRTKKLTTKRAKSHGPAKRKRK